MYFLIDKGVIIIVVWGILANFIIVFTLISFKLVNFQGLIFNFMIIVNLIIIINLSSLG